MNSSKVLDKETLKKKKDKETLRCFSVTEQGKKLNIKRILGIRS